MADWTPLWQFVGAGGAVSALGTVFWARRQHAATSSVERRHHAADSDLVNNQKNSRQLYDDRVAEIAQLKAELSMRGHEVIDLMNQRYELGVKVATLEAEKFSMLKNHARAAIAHVASKPPMQGVEVNEDLTQSGFIEFSDAPER